MKAHCIKFGCLAFALVCGFFGSTFEGRGAAPPENLGLTRWSQFESMLQQYRTLVVRGSTRDEQTRKEIEEFVDRDSQLQLDSLRRFFKNRLMLLVTETTKDSPGLKESEMESRIVSNVTEIQSTMMGFHADLHDNSTLLERLEVAIKYAKSMESIFDADEESRLLFGIVRESEQAGTGQPATAPKLKSEGGDKPQPESEGCSR